MATTNEILEDKVHEDGDGRPAVSVKVPAVGGSMSDPVDVKDAPRGILDMLNVPAKAKILMVALGLIAAAVAGSAEAGIVMPAVVVSIAKVVASICAALGIAQSAGSHADAKK